MAAACLFVPSISSGEQHVFKILRVQICRLEFSLLKLSKATSSRCSLFDQTLANPSSFRITFIGWILGGYSE